MRNPRLGWVLTEELFQLMTLGKKNFWAKLLSHVKSSRSMARFPTHLSTIPFSSHFRWLSENQCLDERNKACVKNDAFNSQWVSLWNDLKIILPEWLQQLAEGHWLYLHVTLQDMGHGWRPRSKRQNKGWVIHGYICFKGFGFLGVCPRTEKKKSFTKKIHKILIKKYQTLNWNCSQAFKND